MSNNVNFPPNTYCPTEYIGLQAFIVEAAEVRNLFYTDDIRVDEIFGVASKRMRVAFRAKSFTASYLILSWEDINIMINLYIVDRKKPLTKEEKEKKRYIDILQFLRSLMPCVILTKSTMVLTGPVSTKVPIGIRDLQSVKFGLVKSRNIRTITVESPYFHRQLLTHIGAPYIGDKMTKQGNFYFIIPHVSDTLFIDRVNRHSIELANTKYGTSDAKIQTTSHLSSLMQNNTTLKSNESERLLYPFYIDKNIFNTPFMACSGQKKPFNAESLHMERWMDFSLLNYFQTSMLIQSHYGKVTDLAGSPDSIVTFFDAGLHTHPPLMEKHLSPAKPSTAPAKKAKKTEEPSFL